jgi:hypothetical protein
MSYWEFLAWADGWMKANGSQEGLTSKEKDDLWSFISEGPQEVRRTLH